MVRQRHTTFKRRLIAYAVTICSAALLLAGAAGLLAQWVQLKQTVPQDLGLQADIIGLNLAAPLTFRDQDAATETLASLAANPNVFHAAVFGTDGTVFARFTRAGRPLPHDYATTAEGYRFAGYHLTVARPVILDGDRLGTIVLAFDLREAYGHLLKWGLMFGAAMAAAVLLALVMANRLQVGLTMPIDRLASAARRIATNKDYGIRVRRTSDDEIGVLTDAFNDMVKEIGQRDDALRSANDVLEQRVQERTAELQLQADTLEQRNRMIALLERVARTANTAPDAEEAIATIVDMLARHFGLRAGRVCLLTESASVPRRSHWLIPQNGGGSARRLDADADDTAGLLERETVDRGSLTIRDYGEAHDGSGAALVVPQVGTLSAGMGLPVVVGGRVDGVLSFFASREDLAAAEASGILQAVAAHVAHVLERDRGRVHLEEYASQLVRANRELRAANVAAQAASAAKDEFLRNMSHELRTPLNAIIGFTELTVGTDLDDTQREALETVLRSANTLLDIVDEILHFSVIQQGDLDSEQSIFDPGEFVEEAVEGFAARAVENEITLVTDIDPDLPACVSGDPLNLRKVLVNLVSNAVKFTRQGEVVVSARIEHDTATMLEIEVRDTGIGIPTDRHADIFECFTQGESGTTRRYGGTGLGLAICRQLARAMGGTICVDSVVGKGSRFTVKVPVALAESAGCSRVPYQVPGLATDRERRALVACAHAPTAEVLQRLLGRCGIASDCVESPGAMVEALTGQDMPDVVVADTTCYTAGNSGSAGLVATCPLLLLKPVGHDFPADAELGPNVMTVSRPVRRRQFVQRLKECLAVNVEGVTG